MAENRLFLSPNMTLTYDHNFDNCDTLVNAPSASPCFAFMTTNIAHAGIDAKVIEHCLGLCKAYHKCTPELLRFGLPSILPFQELTWILMGLTYAMTGTLGSSTCTLQVTHHRSDSLEYP